MENKSNKNMSELDEDLKDIRMLREVFKAISDFVSDIKQPILDLISTIFSSYDGAKLGEDIAQFYRKLVSQGIPDDMAEKMTKEYFVRKMESLPSIRSILDFISSGTIGKGRRGYTEKNFDFDAVVKDLEKIKDKWPEIADEINKIVKKLEELK